MCASPLNSTFLRINCNGNRHFASGARESGLLGARAIDRTAETHECLGNRKKDHPPAIGTAGAKGGGDVHDMTFILDGKLGECYEMATGWSEN